MPTIELPPPEDGEAPDEHIFAMTDLLILYREHAADSMAIAIDGSAAPIGIFAAEVPEECAEEDTFYIGTSVKKIHVVKHDPWAEQGRYSVRLHLYDADGLWQVITKSYNTLRPDEDDENPISDNYVRELLHDVVFSVDTAEEATAAAEYGALFAITAKQLLGHSGNGYSDYHDTYDQTTPAMRIRREQYQYRATNGSKTAAALLLDGIHRILRRK